MKVLVVDDDVVSRMVLMHLVDSCGAYEIFEAEDGADAWAQLAGGLLPAICFCDLRMPRLSGMELLARVNAEPALAGMRFVLASAANDHATMAQASGMGAGGYLVKPFERDLVLAQLAGLAPNAMAAGESARATMARLGIDGVRLLAYLAGFGQQLEAAALELTALLRAGDIEEAGKRIDRLHAGCITLGLENAAARFAALAGGALDAGKVEAALRVALDAVQLKVGAAVAIEGAG
ncbi:MAG: response regulator [Massilia sp.]|nr:response regulator [Massilia sp.]